MSGSWVSLRSKNLWEKLKEQMEVTNEIRTKRERILLLLKLILTVSKPWIVLRSKERNQVFVLCLCHAPLIIWITINSFRWLISSRWSIIVPIWVYIRSSRFEFVVWRKTIQFLALIFGVPFPFAVNTMEIVFSRPCIKRGAATVRPAGMELRDSPVTGRTFE